MNLPALDVRSLLRRYDLEPRKGLGQNFLVDHGALLKIVAAAEIQPMDTVLEIGAGLGSLTRLLASQARKVVAVEIDRNLLPALHEVMRPFENVSVVHGDMLEIKPEDLIGENGYLVVANIPYYITSALIRHLLASPIKPRRIVLTMQSEVAERICADAGEMSLLALSVQVFGKPGITHTIPAAAFYPAPKVDSATLRVDLYPEPVIPEANLEWFFRLAKHGFAQKRKTLRNSLSAGLHISGDDAAALLTAAGIDPIRRAQTLDLAEWRTLVAEYLISRPVALNQ
jgi:16S rRNA (adenine1518-N6/adenine1519-N6)-dimethyltransferase